MIYINSEMIQYTKCISYASSPCYNCTSHKPHAVSLWSQYANCTSHMLFLWETIYGLICEEGVYVRPIMYLYFAYTMIKLMLILYSSCTYHLLYLRHVIYAKRTDETLSLCPNRHKHPLRWEYKRRPSKVLSPHLNHYSHRLISSPLLLTNITSYNFNLQVSVSSVRYKLVLLTLTPYSFQQVMSPVGYN